MLPGFQQILERLADHPLGKGTGDSLVAVKIVQVVVDELLTHGAPRGRADSNPRRFTRQRKARLIGGWGQPTPANLCYNRNTLPQDQYRSNNKS